MIHDPPHLTEALAAALEHLGWRPEDPLVRDAVPTAARGHHLVVVAPPAPPYATPALAGLLSRGREGASVQSTLLLTPGALLEEWTQVAGALGREVDGRMLVARSVETAERRLQDGVPALLIATPDTVLALRRRSRLAPDRVGAVLLAWPESWEDPEQLTELFADVPREVQRVLVTSDPDASRPIVERHAWRAITVGAPAEPVEPVAGMRTLALSWSGRGEALALIVDQLAPPALTVWTADHSHHGDIHRAVAGLGITVTVTRSDPDPSPLLVAFDPPTPDRLARLAAAGEVVLLMPPGTEAYLSRIAPRGRPLLLPGLQFSGPAARRRARLERLLRDADLDTELRGLGELFERYGPSQVAAALYRLWQTGATDEPRAPESAGSGLTRVWVGVGRKDQAGPNDLVGLLANELKVDRGAIGRIDVRETYSLIEVPTDQAEQIAGAMTGRTLRRRRLVARIDRGPGSSRPGREPISGRG